MILYGENNPAPNPRRVRIFLAEKGVDLPQQRLDLRKREHKAADHLARNSLGQVPTLVLDDGTALSETVAICRYLESLHPEPAMFGRTGLEQAQVEMWTRRIEFQLTVPVGMFWRHAHPLTASLIEQHKDFGESNRAHYGRAARWLDGELADGRPFIAGEAYGMADIVALTTIDFASFIGLDLPEEAARLADWRARVSARPSAAA
ncbi:glutathione S-transferase family protein [Caulobacter mirabilis]|uniref:Glutathione S-transferase n=1 Tax=Caulobacter mirabilis TaxID=69666 RepID=A0A2D2AWU9_9CAUL|nr:glutathione S-transferase family protein [Caulobacter mirabilis]ATQ42484.1 glutathione S-transferase [Caulobacter mirabilis]